MAKYIFVTGGVTSSLGKGIIAASLAKLLQSRGLKVTIQKFDPYINVDPGTLNPYEHGECYVTDDGAETDLDLGHYERFIDEQLTRQSNATTGTIYTDVLSRERKGEYEGKTVQVVPHITDAIKERIAAVATDADVVITEVGGTVGDIEILPFLEAIRQFRLEAGRENVCYLHVTLVPYIGPSQEQKTKPTQHSVTELRSRGIQPDAIICRSSGPLLDDVRRKISNQCDVEQKAVVSAADAKSLYDIPLVLHAEGLDDFVCDLLHLDTPPPDLTAWTALTDRVASADRSIRVGIVGKYVTLPDAYLSVVEALRHAGFAHRANVEIEWIDSEAMVDPENHHLITELDGIVIPGGFGDRGIEGKIVAAQLCRDNQVPCLGICLGLQVMTIEFARNVVGLVGANSTEFDPETPFPVIDLMDDQRDQEYLGGTMRLGGYSATLQVGSKVAAAYGADHARERHRHRYEFNNSYRDHLQVNGFLCSGTSPDGSLVEFVELSDHPFWVGTQAHPEFNSRPTRPAPLFAALVAAALSRAEGRNPRLPGVDRDDAVGDDGTNHGAEADDSSSGSTDDTGGVAQASGW